MRLMFAFSAVFCVPAAALAQSSPSPPAMDPILDRNGYSVIDGNFIIDSPGVKIGTRPLEHRFVLAGEGWRHAQIATVTPVFGQPYVNIGGQREPFEGTGTLRYSARRSGNSLSESPTGYVLIQSDGTVFNFTKQLSVHYPFPDETSGIASDVTYPDGEKITFYYKKWTASGLTYARLQSVVSTRGYQLKYSYPSSQDEIPSSIAVINNSIDYCDPAADTCAALSATRPKENFVRGVGPSGRPMDTITDATGGQHVYSWGENLVVDQERNPVSSTYSRTMTVTTAGTVVAYEGISTTYGSNSCSTVNTVFQCIIPITDSLGAITKITWVEGMVVPANLKQVEDPLGRVTSYLYDLYDRIARKSFPEGNYIDYIYDGRGNIIENKYTPKPGSGNLVQSTYAEFPATCDNAKTCNKPISTTDMRGNVTNYTYDGTHGGILSEMASAPTAAAARPLKLTAWAQRYAWVKNSSGALVQAATPIWVESSETLCQSSAVASPTATCDGAAPQTITTFEYGTAGTSEALLVKGVSITSAGETHRTCYQYDPFARKISETKAKADLSTCP